MTNRTSVILKVNNQKVKEEFNSIISSLDGFSLLHANESKSCDLLVM